MTEMTVRIERWKAARRRLPGAIAYFESVGDFRLAATARALLEAIDAHRP